MADLTIEEINEAKKQLGGPKIVFWISLIVTALGAIGAIFNIFPIIWLVAGLTFIIIAIIISARESKSYDEFAKIASESSDIEERTEILTQEKRRELSNLICPGCGAPLKSEPPCKCEYCGRLIR